eukprot:GHRR01012048.1.p1 GENE.GHRR01012048.1~~GHRR01012048.1.p1  ORF type:complete len:530 (+),score=174.35 GHRR01012048.1:2440-4029(+)
MCWFACTGIVSSLQIERLPANKTIIEEAIEYRRPRFVSDTASYMESLARPALDIFLGGPGTVASIVVVPFYSTDDAAYRGGLYVTNNAISDFSAAKRPIISLATTLQSLLMRHLEEGGLLPRAWDLLLQDQMPAATKDVQACRSSVPNMSKANWSGSMVQFLQQQVRNNFEKAQIKQPSNTSFVEELQLSRVLGKGGFGIVYQGVYKGSSAAVKVMHVPKQQRRMMKIAMEMAVMESLSHPNIVRVYDCLTDMVEEAVSGQINGGSDQNVSNPGLNPIMMRFRPIGANDPEDQASCNLMIMELCDKGSLQSALKTGLLHRMSNGRLLIDMQLLLTVLLDTGRSLQHLHSLGYMHCDVKAANVLLKSTRDGPYGFVCKLADFGLVKMLSDDKMYIRNKSVSGTITHLAPERFETGNRVTTAVDVYAFGMLMFELYTGQRPFAKLHPAAIIRAVAKRERPHFPIGTPAEYRALSEVCWAHDSELRPSFDVVVNRLQMMLDSAAGMRSVGSCNSVASGSASVRSEAGNVQRA